ncbi:hypothetical protein ATG66_2069 [Vibrio sp. ES.051]|uniref:hypothetical protein n=1 Tax=Vibrio sp. ES.051 TaxID=1761909 RepID=UPI000BF8DBD5|nr:hypothetical protein [Vibrio sp. ES.051]PFG55753.1 hypothetical protein ATG66_2069 [Vibrio sp. ES.051]
MRITAARNLKYASPDKTVIECEVQCLGELGTDWLPFAMSSSDTEKHGEEAFQRAINGELGEISDYVEPVITPEEAAAMFAESENLWVAQEMDFIDMQIRFHEDSDARATLTEADWRTYRRALRDYVKDGVVTTDTRPKRPIDITATSEASI